VGHDSLVGTVTRYGLDGPGIESRLARDFSYPSKLTLGPTQPHIEWSTGWFSGINRSGRGVGHPFPLVPRLGKEWNYTSTLPTGHRGFYGKFHLTFTQRVNSIPVVCVLFIHMHIYEYIYIYIYLCTRLYAFPSPRTQARTRARTHTHWWVNTNDDIYCYELFKCQHYIFLNKEAVCVLSVRKTIKYKNNLCRGFILSFVYCLVCPAKNP
jgi:hypothetical protein